MPFFIPPRKIFVLGIKTLDSRLQSQIFRNSPSLQYFVIARDYDFMRRLKSKSCSRFPHHKASNWNGIINDFPSSSLFLYCNFNHFICRAIHKRHISQKLLHFGSEFFKRFLKSSNNPYCSNLYSF